eukprot:5489311-Amphidinium_carterae.1
MIKSSFLWCVRGNIGSKCCAIGHPSPHQACSVPVHGRCTLCVNQAWRNAMPMAEIGKKMMSVLRAVRDLNLT